MIMTNATSKPIIEISDLATYLGDRYIHQHLDLTINAHEILAIVGGSGSGKTTLLRAILMLIPIAHGTIKIFGHDVKTATTKEIKAIQRSWGVMFQHSALFSSLTVLENVAFPLLEQTTLSRKMIFEIARLKLALVGLSLDAINQYPSELSGGMQKRVALARAIALDPQLIFLDEPTAGLDPEGASGLDELILSLKNNLGLTVILVTHDVDTLWRITDRVAFLGDGKVLEVDDIAKLAQSKQTEIRDYFNDPRSRTARHIREEV